MPLSAAEPEVANRGKSEETSDEGIRSLSSFQKKHAAEWEAALEANSDEIRKQWLSARERAGTKYIVTSGRSVPDASTPAELARFPRAIVG